MGAALTTVLLIVIIVAMLKINWEKFLKDTLVKEARERLKVMALMFPLKITCLIVCIVLNSMEVVIK